MASSHSHSRVSPSGTGGNGGNNNERPRLTDAEKKQNHIISEQKRRQAIRQGFDRLASMTPGMAGMGRSEAAVLNAAVIEIKKQTVVKDVLKRKLMKENPEISDEWFEAFYNTHAADNSARASNAAAAAGASNHVHSPAASSGSNGSASRSKGKRVKREN